MANLGFILKKNIMDATVNAQLSDSQFRSLITGLFNYATEGKTPDFKDDGVLAALFTMEKPAIDNNNIKWEKKRVEYVQQNKPMEEKPSADNHRVSGHYVGRVSDWVNTDFPNELIKERNNE